jgi:hypothetical protein
MVQAAQDRDGTHAAGQHRARGAPLWSIGHSLPQALMGPCRVEVRGVLPQDAAQMGFAQDQQVVQALAPHAPQEALARGVLPGRAIRRAQLLNAGGCRDPGKRGAVLAVIVMEEVPRPLPEGRRFAELLGDPGVGGVARDADVDPSRTSTRRGRTRVCNSGCPLPPSGVCLAGCWLAACVPCPSWVACTMRTSQPRNATRIDLSARTAAPTFLIRDNDRKFGAQFAQVAVGSRIAVLRTPVRAPRANAACERFLGSVRRECLDHLLILHAGQLHRALREYGAYFNDARPHQGLGQAIPGAPGPPSLTHSAAPIMSIPILGGLHHDYRRAS